MTRDTHVEQSNGFSRGPLVDSIRPHLEQIRFTLGRLNGVSFWAYSLWRAPDDVDLRLDVPLSDAYLQCAGSARAMTIEVRIVGDDGVARQYTVGKPGEVPSGAPTETITWDDGRRSVAVHPSEVFTADEAGDVFVAYYLDDAVPEPYVLRELHLRM